MRLTPGTRLGPYEIVGPLGAGGMGEVYRARDTRLGRNVAIKVLPARRGTDEHALARFEREAQAVAALSHPNILALHDLGHEGDVVYAVSELLDGETLGQRLAAGPLPHRKALETAAQIARGLAAAHARGIVHRDLKPDNVFLTRDGQVKILDFGLAKMSEPPTASPDDRTRTSIGAPTDPGTVMGTVGYMSPEQVRGLPADHRSDIFTLGAILYEMVAGTRAFAGSTPADTSSAILNQDPPELESGDRDVSPAMQELIRHCLEKQPEQRFQSAQDLAFDLERLARPVSASVPATARRSPRPRRRTLALAGLLVLVAAALPAAFLLGRDSARNEPPTFSRLTFRRGTIRSARMASDGQTIVYGAAWEGDPIRIFTTRPDSPASRRLDLPDADILAISSRGEMAISVGRTFLTPHRNLGTLARVPLAGGVPRLLLENVQEADWSPDGEELAVVHEQEGRNRLEYPIGNLLYETNGWIGSPRVSPDGTRVAFLDHLARWDDAGVITIVDREGNRRTLGPQWSASEGLDWSPSGDEIWVTATPGVAARSLWAIPLQGEVRPVLRGASDLKLFDLLPGGRALLASTNQRREVRVGSAAGERDLSWFDWSLSTYLDSDGETVLINEQGQGGEPGYSIYLRTTDGAPAVHIGAGIPLALSPDEAWVLAVRGQSVVLYPTGPGTERELLGGLRARWGGWLPDGRGFLYSTGGGDRTPRVYLYELGGESRPVTDEGFYISAFTDPVAPDGRRFVAARPDGTPLIFSLDGTQPREIPGLEPGDTVIRWSDDGSGLYFYRQGMPAPYGRVELATGRREVFGELAPPDRAGAVGVWPVLVSADGRRYAYSYPRYLTDLALVDGL